MNIPYAATDTFSFFILLASFSLIIFGFGIIILINIIFIKKNRTNAEKLNLDLLKSFSELKERVDAINLIFSQIKDDLNNFQSDKTSQHNLLNELKSEITRIADGISGQDIMTKAIDLARSGANIEKIISETGLSKSDAEALIKFHNK